jgi:hypothetical protein
MDRSVEKGPTAVAAPRRHSDAGAGKRQHRQPVLDRGSTRCGGGIALHRQQADEAIMRHRAGKCPQTSAIAALVNGFWRNMRHGGPSQGFSRLTIYLSANQNNCAGNLIASRPWGRGGRRALSPDCQDRPREGVGDLRSLGASWAAYKGGRRWPAERCGLRLSSRPLSRIILLFGARARG